MGYVFSAALWTGIGYYFHQVIEAQDDMLNARVKKLHEARARRDVTSTASLPEN